jgi:hypothetical protein
VPLTGRAARRRPPLPGGRRAVQRQVGLSEGLRGEVVVVVVKVSDVDMVVAGAALAGLHMLYRLRGWV